MGDRPIREYVSAGGVVVDHTGEQVLVLLRPERLGPCGLPEVRLPKGHVEPGESLGAAALREVAEESGLTDLEIVADLSRQTVEFEWKQHRYVREEAYFLMRCSTREASGLAEEQFEPLWLSWGEALSRLTYSSEQEWVRRAQQERFRHPPDPL